MYALLKTVGPEQWHQQHCCGVRGRGELQQSLQHRHHQQQQVKKNKCIIVRQSVSHQAKMAAKNDKIFISDFAYRSPRVFDHVMSLY